MIHSLLIRCCTIWIPFFAPFLLFLFFLLESIWRVTSLKLSRLCLSRFIESRFEPPLRTSNARKIYRRNVLRWHHSRFKRALDTTEVCIATHLFPPHACSSPGAKAEANYWLSMSSSSSSLSSKLTSSSSSSRSSKSYFHSSRDLLPCLLAWRRASSAKATSSWWKPRVTVVCL
ncbi:hypothetical protein KCU65_g376, partial [Aureobasidium melanogenum]